ncbi:MAG: autotransporter outer membrane beta-barrel domain-containing protein [Gammaproteobacteria bacterium]|nr:autotransporter outer membrane beta-barrel domain-containing protein [Gammaproteobacteria bacterium]
MTRRSPVTRLAVVAVVAAASLFIAPVHSVAQSDLNANLRTGQQHSFVRELVRISQRASYARRALYAPKSLEFQSHGDSLRYDGRSLAAGDEFSVPVSIWGSAQRDGEPVLHAFDSKRYAFLGGVDINVLEDVLFGLAVGYEQPVSHLDEPNGVTLMPYLAARFLDHWSVDFSGGYASEQFSLTSSERVTGVTSTFDEERWFIKGGAHYLRNYGNLRVLGRAGLLWSTEASMSERASNDAEARSVQVGAELAYQLGRFEPFVVGAYENGYNTSGLVDQSDTLDTSVLGVGLRFFGGNGITGALEYNTYLGRDSYDDDTINFLIRAEF